MHAVLERRYNVDSVEPTFIFLHSTVYVNRGDARNTIDWLLNRDRNDDSPLNRGETVRYSVVDIAIDVTYSCVVGSQIKE
jgi:hypothetical protein